MEAANKGHLYARQFRKAGSFLANGNISRASEVLKEGEQLARKLGDEAMAQRFADEIERIQKSAAS